MSVDPLKDETTAAVPDANGRGRSQMITYTKTIQAAINKAGSGATIKISQGVYKEHIVIKYPPEAGDMIGTST